MTDNELTFRQLAETDPQELARRIRHSGFSPGLLARAAEAMGKSSDSELAIHTLLETLTHSDLVVREGSLYGLQHHMGDATVRRAIENIAQNDESETLRSIARDILSD